MPKATGRLICRYTTHDWWALAYPPTRRWECKRCGEITEEPLTLQPRRMKLRVGRGRRGNESGD